MAFPPSAFSDHDGRVYTDWEEHKLSAAGARAFSLLVALSSLALLGLDRIIFRLSDTGRLYSTWVTVAALLLTALAAGGTYLATLLKGVELQRPRSLATLVALVAVAGGAFAAVAAGGLSGPLGFGLVPALLVWPALMPGGGVRSALPVGGGVVVHAAVCAGLGGTALTLSGSALVIFMVLATVAALTAGQVIEHWRGRAADASQTDWLTGALSRSALEERMAGLLAMRARTVAPITLVMFDVDRFKVVNDTHGRGAGDEVLELLVAGIKAEIRTADFIGRYGGDEFLLVLDECTGNSAVLMLERLRERLAVKPITVGDTTLDVSFSAGIVSVAPGDPLVLRDLLRRSERALVISKDSGRNRTLVAPPPPPADAGKPSVAEMPAVVPPAETSSSDAVSTSIQTSIQQSVA